MSMLAERVDGVIVGILRFRFCPVVLALDGGAVDARADQDAQELVAVADVAVLVGATWVVHLSHASLDHPAQWLSNKSSTSATQRRWLRALKSRECAEKYVGTGPKPRNACTSAGTAVPMLSRVGLSVSLPINPTPRSLWDER
jgi:hypothetical protein